MHVLHFEEKHYKRKQNESCFKQNLIVTSVPISDLHIIFHPILQKMSQNYLQTSPTLVAQNKCSI